MLPPTLTLGIDVGTTNIKVALVATAHGRPVPLRTASRPTPMTGDGIVAAVGACSAEVLDDETAAKVRAIGIASMAESGLLLDDSGSPLTPVVPWDDRRAGDDAARLSVELGQDRVFARTGVRLGPKPPLAKWAWLARTEPALWARSRAWAGIADLVALALTGTLATDHTLAGRTGAYGLGARQWLGDLLSAVGLDEGRLPRVVADGSPVGFLLRGPLSDLGVRVGTPVVVAGHDHAVGAHVAGVRSPGQTADSLGTSEALYRVVTNPPEDLPAAVAVHGMSLVRTVAGEHLAIVAGSGTGGAVVAWWTARFGPLPDADVDRADPRGQPLVLPYLAGRQCPSPDPTARWAMLDVEHQHGRRDLDQALFEGLSLQARWMGQVQGALAGTTTTELVVLGRPSANPRWLATKAAVGPWPVLRVATRDAVVVGAAAVAAERTGHDGPVLVSAERVPIDPDPRYDLLFDRFVRAACADRPPLTEGNPT